jgi:integrase/recombinase XerD
MSVTDPVGPLVQAFFTEHLLQHKRVSPQTVSAYRDAFRLLLHFLHNTTGREPAAVRLADLDCATLLAFLEHLERARHNTIRSRNARLAALRSFFRYVAFREPACLALVTQVLAIPRKRTDHRLVGSLTRPEMDAVLAAPDRATWTGRRDHALFLTLYNTGARVSEIIALRRTEVTLAGAPALQLHGKGRKERVMPLWARTARVLRTWLAELGDTPGGMAFPNARGRPLTRHGVSHLLAQAVGRAGASQPSLATKRVSPHVIRHTTAMHLLHAGVDPTVIALWLGHESVETTHIYVEADLTLKEQALAHLTPAGPGAGRFKAKDAVLTFLSGL